MNDWAVWFLHFILPRRYWYRNYYLWSRHWRTFRLRALKILGNVCGKCGKPEFKKVSNRFNKVTLFDVHHKTYKNLWHERVENVEILCRNCHKLEHGK